MNATMTPPEAAPIEAEHRFRARRVQIRRAERRRRKRLLIAFTTVVVLAAVAVGSLYSPMLDVDYLDLQGLRHLEPADVEAVAELATGQRMIDLKTADAESALGALPWVDRVTVVRRWPDTVEIRVAEHEPVAVLELADGARYAATNGGFVAGTASAALDASLPVLMLDPAIEVAVGRSLPRLVAEGVDLVGGLTGQIRDRAVAATVTAGGVVEVTLDHGIHVVFGTADDAKQKILTVETILGGAVSPDCIERIDVSVPSPFTVTRAESCR